MNVVYSLALGNNSHRFLSINWESQRSCLRTEKLLCCLLVLLMMIFFVFPDTHSLCGLVVKVVLMKYFDMPPLTVAEAIEQLENVDHASTVSEMKKPGRLISYTKRKGGSGLIIPKGNAEAGKWETLVLEKLPA